MSTPKTKRGLGLLVIALLGALIGLVALRLPANDGAGEAITLTLLVAALLAVIGGVVGGLGLIAWGLIRD